MKLRFILSILFVGLGMTLAAQVVKKTQKLNEEEVPVAVRLAFKNDFGQIPDDGTWTVNFNVVSEGTRTVAKPTWYTFRKGTKEDKIEVRYSPEGKLELFKGLKKTGENL
jgi:hypothetical protein